MTAAQQLPTEEWSLEEAVELFFKDGFKDGDLLSTDWLAHSLNAPRKHRMTQDEAFTWMSRVEAFKHVMLSDHRIALQNVKGKGYRVVPPAEQARYAAEEASRYMTKGMKKADFLLKYTRLDELDKDERRRHTDTEVRMSALAGMVGKGKRDVFALFTPQ